MDMRVGYDTRMNQVLEWLPLIVFFLGFKLLGLYWATGALMVVCVAVMFIHRLRAGSYKVMHVVTAAVALVLGGATFLFHDTRFIQWKPTVLLGVAAAAFLGSSLIGKQPLARRMLESAFSEKLDLPGRQWQFINTAWAVWFALLAIANIYIARHFEEAVWVNFKVFGISIAMMLFMIPQVLWLSGKTPAAQAQRS
jgi:intracellular septation protein